MKSENIAEIAKALREFEIPPRFEANEPLLLMQLWRLLSDGLPVTPEQVLKITSNIQMSLDVATAFINRNAENDDDGNIVGIFGLSQKDHPHRFVVKGQALTTWCAWDSLFLPALLNKAATVESFCPATKKKIRLAISPETIEQVEPSNAVLSVVVPETGKRTLESVEDIRSMFCCLVHFFSSADAATEWISDKSQNIMILSIEEGYYLGKLAFEELHKYI